jgi:hypothetical protein
MSEKNDIVGCFIAKEFARWLRVVGLCGWLGRRYWERSNFSYYPKDD